MIDGKIYIEKVKLFFSFLVTEFGFNQIKEIENGNAFYDVEYRDTKKSISVSYENIEDYLQVIVFKLNNGRLPDYDDKTHTLHLSELNKAVLSRLGSNDMRENNLLFSKFEAKDNIERKLLKSAKELRLSLKHWDKD
jgi:DNA primase catalytic subunit